MELRRLGSSPRLALTLEDRTLDVLARGSREGFDIVIDGVSYSISTARPLKGRGKQAEDEFGHFENGKWKLLSPIAGSVVEVRVSVGDKVDQGTILMVVEAMKMQNELRSRVSGTVSAIEIEKGQRVEPGTALLEVSAASGGPT